MDRNTYHRNPTNINILIDLARTELADMPFDTDIADSINAAARRNRLSNGDTITFGEVVYILDGRGDIGNSRIVDSLGI